MKELYKNSASLDALFERSWSENAVIPLRTDKLYPFAGHPFKVLDDEDMAELVESIRTHGVLTPLLVRPAKPAPMRWFPATAGSTPARNWALKRCPR